jgi:hypothetical protein
MCDTKKQTLAPGEGGFARDQDNSSRDQDGVLAFVSIYISICKQEPPTFESEALRGAKSGLLGHF